jgi:hypothetical protein
MKYKSVNGLQQMVRLAVDMAKHIRGNVHVQTNPFSAYSAEETVANAIRMLTSIPPFTDIDSSNMC